MASGASAVLTPVQPEPEPRLAVVDRPGEPFVVARDVVKRYRPDVVANDGICLEAHLGEVVAILGPNGAGKTTFVLQLLGLVRPTSGTLLVGGIDVARHPDGVKRLASYQPQGHMALGGVEVRHALFYTGCLRGLPMSEARQQAADVAAAFALEAVLGTPINQLSGGWRRLVDVAVAFMGRPRLIVLDEPTNDLDPVHRRLIWRQLNALRESRAATCLLVTHNLLEAERVVDQVVIFQRGRVVATGSPGVLKRALGTALRLDVYLHATGGAAEASEILSWIGPTREMRPGHLQVLVPPSKVPRAIALITSDSLRQLVDDFRLAPPSLEDVYLHMEDTRHATGSA